MTISRRRFLLAAFGAGGAAALGLTQRLDAYNLLPVPASGANLGQIENLQAARRAGFALGTEVSMLALHPSKQTAAEALDIAFRELETVEAAMSIYRHESQLSILNRTGRIEQPHPYLLSVLRTALQISEQSSGAFDVTVQPLWELYAKAKDEGRLPSDDEIERARAKIGWRNVVIQSGGIRLDAPGMAVTLNGIAQGFAADRAVAALRAKGVTHALLNTGEFGSIGRKASNDPWIVGIQHPRREDACIGLARLEGLCLSTSGDYETTFSSDYAFNHIFDPQTGRSPRDFSSVSVVSPLAVDADALSTAVFVLGAARGTKLLSLRQSSGFFVRKDGTTMQTDGFPLA